MAAPIVKWYNAANDTEETSYDIGLVDAGALSSDKTFLIWNNRGGATEVSDMTSCRLTVKDSSGGDTGDLVLETWLEAQVDSMGETEFTPIGGTTSKTIEAGGDNTTGNETISGRTNSGELVAEDNYAEVTLHANIPANATAGLIDFILRVTYQYV